MTVTGEQLQGLRDALVSAYPDSRSLAAMALFELGENLNVITEAGNLNDRAFELIRWCQAAGRLDELVRAARAQNPGNEALAAVFDAWPFAPAQGLEDPTRLAKGQRVGGEKNTYTIESLIGCGAMGVVYRVLDANERPRALKLLLGRAMRDRQALVRIKREATIGGRFNDEVRENVVDVFDVGLDPKLGDGGCAYLAMELLRGETLAERVETRGRLPPAAVIALAEQLANVLQEAARADLRVVHCDLKPENLFFARLRGGETLKVLDFGVAQVMRERTLGQAFRFTGTPLFAAVEQWEPDAPLTPAADLWAFGLIVFYALTGGYFWASKVLPGLMDEILLQRPYRAASARAAGLGVTLPEGFDAWFARCVCAEVAGRFPSADEAIAALRDKVRWPDDRAQPLPGMAAPTPAPRVSVPVSCRAATPPDERGEGLDERVARDGPMALPEVAAMLQRVAQWLALHRAVSPVRGHLEPSRVRFLADGSARVLGLEGASVTDARGGAGATRTLLNGVPGVGYVPPSLRREGGVDDAWALARVAFFALAGEPYVRAATVRGALLEAGWGEEPSARSGRLPEGFDGWFQRCSEGRFGGVQEAVEAFARLRAAEAPKPAFVAETPTPSAPVVRGTGIAAPVRQASPERPLVAAPPVVPPPAATPSRVRWIAAGGTLAAMLAAALVLRGCPTLPPQRDAGADDAVEEAAEAAVVVPPPREPTCPEGMALIRGGTFQMGSTDGVGGPAHAVTLETFCIDRTETSVTEYRACVTAGGCTAPNAYVRTRGDNRNFCNWDRSGAEDHPVNCVDWPQAKAYCEWSGNPRGAGRLLREAEWEYAARGTAGRLYPWGDAAPNGTLTNLCGSECVAYGRSQGHSGWSGISGWTDGFGATAPVTAFESGETPEHVRNLAGNVWEWVEDVYVSDAYAQHTADGHLRPRDASATPQSTESRVLRGGGWGSGDAAWARAAFRNGNAPTYRSYIVGVRCARGAS